MNLPNDSLHAVYTGKVMMKRLIQRERERLRKAQELLDALEADLDKHSLALDEPRGNGPENYQPDPAPKISWENERRLNELADQLKP